MKINRNLLRSKRNKKGMMKKTKSQNKKKIKVLKKRKNLKNELIKSLKYYEI